MVFIVIGGVFVVLAGSGAWYDWRMRRKGKQVHLYSDATEHQSQIDLTRYERR